jgi:octaprenyl-diphosphate synthase
MVGLIAGEGKASLHSETAAKVAGAAENLGVAFQILDDVTNLSTGNPGKKRGDDVVEGKKSYIIVAHLKERPRDADIITECFEQAGQEGIRSPAVERLITLVADAGTLSASAQVARDMIASACGEFARLFPDRTERTAVVTQLFTRFV